MLVVSGGVGALPSSLKGDPAPELSLGQISASPAAISQFNFWQCLLQSMRLGYKKANRIDFPRLQILKNHYNQWGIVWRKSFLLLSPGKIVVMLTLQLQLSLLNTGSRWKSIGCGI